MQATTTTTTTTEVTAVTAILIDLESDTMTVTTTLATVKNNEMTVAEIDITERIVGNKLLSIKEWEPFQIHYKIV